MRFLVNIAVEWPENMPMDQWKALIEEEKAAVKVMMDKGMVLRMWREVGFKGNWGIWETDTIEELQRALASLPFWRFLRVKVHPLIKHEMELYYEELEGKLPPLKDGF